MDDICNGIQAILLALCFLSTSFDEPGSYGEQSKPGKWPRLPSAGSTMCGSAFIIFMIFRHGYGGRVMVDRQALGADVLLLGGVGLLLWAIVRMSRLQSVNVGK